MYKTAFIDLCNPVQVLCSYYLTKQSSSIALLTFFAQKIETIRSDIAAMDVSCTTDMVLVDHEVGPDKQLSAFKPLSESDVFKLIQKSTKKTCPLDPMPTSLVVSCLDLLLPIITCMVNSSLPNVWKEAIVTPLLASH